MLAKYKKGTIVLTDYFSEPGQYEEFEIINYDVLFQGSLVYVSLQNLRTQQKYHYVQFKVKDYNKLFFTKSELRYRKLKRLNENDFE